MNQMKPLTTKNVRLAVPGDQAGGHVQPRTTLSAVESGGGLVPSNAMGCPPDSSAPDGGGRCREVEHSWTPRLRRREPVASQDEPDETTVMDPDAGIIGTEAINATLKHHAVRAGDWGFREAAALLHEWSVRFNQEFGLRLDTPVLQFARIGRRTLGTYQPGRNGIGLHHELTLNTRYLERPLAQTLEVLLHEQLHEWQQLHGRPAKSNYHNREFRDKARRLGLIVDTWGHSLGVAPGPFTELLERYHVDITVLPLPQEGAPLRILGGTSKLKKWSCGCTNVRAAVQLRAQCLRCGRGFEMVDSTLG